MLAMGSQIYNTMTLDTLLTRSFCDRCKNDVCVCLYCEICCGATIKLSLQSCKLLIEGELLKAIMGQALSLCPIDIITLQKRDQR